jgi:aldehyde:ferredoxin oxidoreductase
MYAVNPFGADHQSHEHDFSYMEGASELEKERLKILGLNNPQDALVLNEEKVRYVWVTQKVYSLADCLCLCQFDWGPAWTMYGPEHFSPMLKAVTGWDISLEELLIAAERRINMMRIFNAKEGFGRKDDTLSAKVHKPKEGGPSDGYAVSHVELERAKDIYYRMASWDVSTGNPTPEKSEQLGLGWTKD